MIWYLKYVHTSQKTMLMFCNKKSTSTKKMLMSQKNVHGFAQIRGGGETSRRSKKVIIKIKINKD
jgi:hypothetical protein